MKKQKQTGYLPPESPIENPENTSSIYVPINVEKEAKQPEIKQNNNNASCFSLEYYQPFFDIETHDVGERIARSFIPIKGNFLEVTKGNPDLYGPFWIYTTLIFAISASANFSQYLKASDKDKWESDFNFVPVAASLIYGIGFVVPILVCFIMRFLGSEIQYVSTICIYGYSYACFIIVSFLCIIPNDGLEWGLIAYGVANSSIFLLNNFRIEMNKLESNKRYLILGLVGGSQLILFLMFKFYFFKQLY